MVLGLATGHSGRRSTPHRWTPAGTDFNAGKTDGRRWAVLLAASGQLHDRHWAGSHGRRHRSMLGQGRAYAQPAPDDHQRLCVENSRFGSDQPCTPTPLSIRTSTRATASRVLSTLLAMATPRPRRRRTNTRAGQRRSVANTAAGLLTGRAVRTRGGRHGLGPTHERFVALLACRRRTELFGRASVDR